MPTPPPPPASARFPDAPPSRGETPSETTTRLRPVPAAKPPVPPPPAVDPALSWGVMTPPPGAGRPVVTFGQPETYDDQGRPRPLRARLRGRTVAAAG
ncbi:MAG: hypothetical protein H5T76_01525, partial [Streptomyces sp.]|nr:hypothetical protein [Streptomyces sp.]